MNYYISDLHLFHENSIKFDERPFDSLDERHETIKKRWNSKITNGDRVFILGDISYRGKNEDLIAYISTLKGQKILVKGNHDDVSVIDIISFLQKFVIIKKFMIQLMERIIISF